MVEQISVTILTKNSEKYLEKCLDALQAFNEIVIIDNGSSDETLKIAENYPNTKIVEHEFIGFGPLKNMAIKHAKNDWIFSIDSDEIVKPELVDEIYQLDLSDEQIVYSLPRDNYYNRRLIRCCGWYPDRVLRLFNRNHTCFNDLMVHESILLHPFTRRIELSYGVNHFPFENVEDLIDKTQRYSTLFAEQSTKSATPFKAVMHATYAFIKDYFFQKGFLYGYEGILISVSNANGVFYKYIKLYEKKYR